MSTCRYCNGSKMAKTEAGYRPCPFCNGTGESDSDSSSGKKEWSAESQWKLMIVVILGLLFLAALANQ